MSTAVKYFDSTMSGAPIVTRTAGDFISVLDACLVNGFGSVTLDSLVIADNVATGTVSTGHNFAMYGNTGPVIEISGATPSGLNGQWRIAVTSSTQFTFATSGISNQTATGTISAKRAPAGFSKAFSGTNKAAYRADAVSSTRAYLRVDDTDTRNAIIRGHQSMSGIDTGTEVFPVATIYLYKIDTLRANAPWWFFADDRSFYCFLQTNSNGGISGAMFFGDLADLMSETDSHACGLIGHSAANASSALPNLDSTAAALLRSYTGLTGTVGLIRYNHSRFNTTAMPCPVNNGVLLFPVEAWESTVLPRGLMPGLYRALNTQASIPHLTVYENIAQLPNRSLLVMAGGDSVARFVFDLTGPWRS